MKLQEIRIQHFRNYEDLQLSFPAAINLFVGQNAQGKTNLLEAISLLALTKSHRATKDQEMIQWGQSQALLFANVERSSRELKLQLQLTERGKKARLNGIDRKKMTDYVGNFNVVLFSPEDLQLIKGAPSERRRFLDIEIGQISPTYLHDSAQYQKIMIQRNAVLREQLERPTQNHELVSVWDEQLIETGSRMIERRLQFMQKLQKYASDIHSRISDGLEKLLLGYTCSIAPVGTSLEIEGDIRELFRQELDKMRRKDFARAVTSVGPHRDDISAQINGYDVGTFASQGQQRTTALSMKLAEIELIRNEVGEYPILLLDDVLSELDSTRQIQLLRSMGERVQTFITATNTYGLEEFMTSDTEVFQVKSGTLGK